MQIDIPSILQLLLIFCYMVIGHISLIQLSRILHFQHPIKSFQFWFLLISLIWCVERAITFIWSPILPTRAINFLFIIPASFQFASFSLLVLYNSFLLYQHHWNQYRAYYLLAYGVTNGTVFIASFALAYFTAAATANDRDSVRLLNRLHTGWFTIMFSILLIVYGYYGYHLYKHYTNGKKSSSSNHSPAWSSVGHSNSSTSQLFLTIIAWCVFFTRWFYNLLTCINPEKFGLVMTSDRRDFILDIPTPIFLILVVWEVLPSSLVLYVSRHIPATDRTLWTEMKQHGLCFCCSKKSRNALLDNQSPYLLDDRGHVYPNSSIFSTNSLFGDGQAYPHVATYQVLNDEHTATSSYPFDDNNDDQIQQLLPESDVYIGSISDHHAQQYHQQTNTQTQNVHLDWDKNSEQRELKQQEQQQQQQQQQQRQNKRGSRPGDSMGGYHGSTSQQLQIQSQLHQHLAQYHNHDDGGDLF